MRITVRPRVHVGLISMHAEAPRRNGGIGFALSGPTAQLEFCAAKDIEIEDLRPRPLSTHEAGQLAYGLSEVRKALKLRYGLSVRITGTLATHVGMGSGTAIRIACIEALAAMNGVSAERETITRLSGRGGTSGIGINTYFDGGLVLDLGVPQDGHATMPSSLAHAARPPLVVGRAALPPWRVTLFVPRSIPTKSQAEEADFFRSTLPLRPEASFRACYEALFGVYAAVLERDPLAFAGAIERMQKTEWKRLEWQAHGDPLMKLRTKLRDKGADYVGLSSLGPMLFVSGSSSFENAIMGCEEELDCDIFSCTMTNSGRSLVD